MPTPDQFRKQLMDLALEIYVRSQGGPYAMKPANAFRCASEWLRDSESICQAMVAREREAQEALDARPTRLQQVQ